MELLIKGHDHFELMWNLPAVVYPQDFPPGATSYFTFQLLNPGQYQIQIAEQSYTDDALFMAEVSSKLAGQQVFGFVSHSSDELTLGFRGLHFIAEYEWIKGQWLLRWFEDFNIRKQSLVERRLGVSSDYMKLKKLLA